MLIPNWLGKHRVDIEVDLSRYSLLRRIGLRWLAELIYRSVERALTRRTFLAF